MADLEQLKLLCNIFLEGMKNADIEKLSQMRQIGRKDKQNNVVVHIMSDEFTRNSTVVSHAAAEEISMEI